MKTFLVKTQVHENINARIESLLTHCEIVCQQLEFDQLLWYLCSCKSWIGNKTTRKPEKEEVWWWLELNLTRFKKTVTQNTWIKKYPEFGKTIKVIMQWKAKINFSSCELQSKKFNTAFEQDAIKIYEVFNDLMYTSANNDYLHKWFCNSMD